MVNNIPELLLCRYFIEKYGGKFMIESEVGKGSEFSFTIPQNGNPVPEEVIKIIVPNAVSEVKVKLLKILIAEDDEISGRLIEAMIKRISKQVLIAKEGNEVIEICRNNPDIDLVLMDISMPRIDGYEATRQIRLFNKEVIIIAQTALAHTRDIENAISAGCNDHISKPIKKIELMKVIQKYFGE